MKNEKLKMKNEKCVLLRDTMHAQTNRSSGANKSLPHVRYMHLHKEMLTRSVSSVPSSPFSFPDPVLITVIVVLDSVTMFLNITIFIPPVQMLTRMHPEFSVSVLSPSCCSSCIHSCSNTLSLILCSSPYLSSIVHPPCYSVFRPLPSYS